MSSELESELAAAEAYAPQRTAVMAAVAAGAQRRLVRRRIVSIGGVVAGVVVVAVVATAVTGPDRSPAGPAPAMPSVSETDTSVSDGAPLTEGSALGTVIGTAPAQTGPAGTGYPPGYTAELDALIGPYAIKVMAVADDYPGFADLKVDYPTRSVQVFFDGHLPADVLAMTAELAAKGIGLVHVQTYSAGFLEKAASKLATAIESAGIALTRVGPAAGYGAVEFAGPELSIDPALQAQVRAMAPQVIGDIPVEFVPVRRHSD